MRRGPRRLLLALAALSFVPPAGAALPAGAAPRLQPRVIGGAPSAAGAYPYAARIEIDGLGSCSGTLLASRFVLTAGHCATEVMSGAAITNPARFHVRIGNTRPVSDPIGYVAVDLVLRHPAFDADRLTNDVTLLRLAAPVTAPTIDLLPPARAGLLAARSSGIIAGWGLITQTPNEVLAPTLYAGRIRLMSDAACTKEWRTDVNLPTMFCAGPSAPARPRRAAATRAVRCSSSTRPTTARTRPARRRSAPRTVRPPPASSPGSPPRRSGRSW